MTDSTAHATDAGPRARKLPESAVADQWIAEATGQLARHETLINTINVFPVRDRDTGSNLKSTMSAAHDALLSDAGGAAHATWGERLLAAAEAAGRAALGNSGTVLVVVLQALGERLAHVKRLDALSWAAALSAADVRASSAISDREPASLFDVFAAAAGCAPTPDSGWAGLVQLLDDQISASVAAVRATLSGSEELARYGVIDAGALGVLVILESLRAAVTGEPFREDLLSGLPGTALSDLDPSGSPDALQEGVEVVCTLDASPLDAAVLRASLDAIGQSVIMSPLGPRPDDPSAPCGWRLHVHVTEESVALDAVRDVAEPRDVRITSLSPGHDEAHTHDDDGAAQA